MWQLTCHKWSSDERGLVWRLCIRCSIGFLINKLKQQHLVTQCQMQQVRHLELHKTHKHSFVYFDLTHYMRSTVSRNTMAHNLQCMYTDRTLPISCIWMRKLCDQTADNKQYSIHLWINEIWCQFAITLRGKKLLPQLVGGYSKYRNQEKWNKSKR